MRVHFELKEFEPMILEHKGEKYPFSQLTPLAEKRRSATNIHEYVYKLPLEEYVYVTVVGDEDQTSSQGIHKGWYLIESISEKEAQFGIDALSKFTALYR
jgi:hypothetical protein